MKLRTHYSLTATFLLLFIAVSSQIVIAESDPGPLKISSKILKETRMVWIHLPESYGLSNDKYPVLYLMDAEWSFDLFKGVVDSLCTQKQVPELIIVAVENIDQSSRLRDFTPTPVSKYPGSGGADNFLAFLKDELIPYIDTHYRTSSLRILYGHSSGGLITTYALMTIPEMFDGYLASSPGLSWDNELLIEKAGAFFPQHKELKKFLYIAIGSDDFPEYIKAVQALIPLLETSAPAKFIWKYDYMENEDHESVPNKSFPNALSAFFRFFK